MPKTLVISVSLGEDFSGLNLSAQIIKSNGTNITSLISEGFFEVGQGFYLWEYSNFPENFRGGVKFYDSSDLSKVIFFVNVSTENLTSCDSCEEVITEIGDSFDITYSDQSGLNFYALLFSAQDLTKAWKLDSSSFETYFLSSHEKFALPLVEDSEKIGWYSYSIDNVEKLPPVIGNEFYFIEVWQRKGTFPNRSVDSNTGNLRVYWGSKNGEWLEIARKVWEYGTRSLTSFPEIPPGITPQQIWEYSTRTLTAGGSSCDYTELEAHILAAITLSTGKTLEELSTLNNELGSSIQNTFDLLKTCCSTKEIGTPIIQNPQIGPRGSKGKRTDMRFG